MTCCGAIDVAERLRHLAALLVDDEAVREDAAVRRAVARADADEQRRLEPAAVLVGAFEVQVGRPGELRPCGEHRLVARARVEPDVEDVALALERRAAALLARETRPARSRRRADSYQASALVVSKMRGRVLDERRRQHRLAARLVQASAGIGTPHARWREMHQSGRVDEHARHPLAAPRRESSATRVALARRRRRAGRPC